MFSTYSGYNAKCITMQKADDAQINKGDMVKMNSSLGILVNADKDDAFVGVATDVRGNDVTVQTEGYVELKMDNNSGITCGPQKLVAGTSGVTKDKVENSVNYVRTVVCVDTDKKIVGVIL